MQCCLFESPLCSWISSAMLHQDDSSPKVLLPSLMNSRLSLWSCKQARTACPSLTVVVTPARAAPHSNKSRSPNCHSLALTTSWPPRAVPCATQPHSRLANLPPHALPTKKLLPHLRRRRPSGRQHGHVIVRRHVPGQSVTKIQWANDATYRGFNAPLPPPLESLALLQLTPNIEDPVSDEGADASAKRCNE
jgi:hypothetical protein